MDGIHIDTARAAPDLSRYRSHLAHMALDPDREEEVLRAIWRIMSSFVDLAWGDDPVQHVVPVRSDILLSQTFEPAAEAKGESEDQ